MCTRSEQVSVTSRLDLEASPHTGSAVISCVFARKPKQLVNRRRAVGFAVTGIETEVVTGVGLCVVDHDSVGRGIASYRSLRVGLHGRRSEANREDIRHRAAKTPALFGANDWRVSGRRL